VVNPIAGLGGTAVDRGVVVVTVIRTDHAGATGRLQVTVCIPIEALVGNATTVVVEAVADLKRTRVHQGIRVVAVTVAGRVTV
jgi:hypothetical protein